MFTMPAMNFLRGGADAPDEIFGASLTSWFDSRFGVTLDVLEVDEWANQATGPDAVQDGAANRPEYIASGAGGTPDVDFPVAPLAGRLAFTAAIAAEFTVYVFMNATGAVVKNLLWDGSRGLYPGGLTLNNPSIFNGSWFTSTDTNNGWHLTRFSVRISGSGDGSIAVDDSAEQLFTLAAIPTGSWNNIARPSQELQGLVKQILVVDEYVNDADPRNAQVADYFKDVYPSLVPW